MLVVFFFCICRCCFNTGKCKNYTHVENRLNPDFSVHCSCSFFFVMYELRCRAICLSHNLSWYFFWKFYGIKLRVGNNQIYFLHSFTGTPICYLNANIASPNRICCHMQPLFYALKYFYTHTKKHTHTRFPFSRGVRLIEVSVHRKLTSILSCHIPFVECRHISLLLADWQTVFDTSLNFGVLHCTRVSICEAVWCVQFSIRPPNTQYAFLQDHLSIF